jgi:membrane protease YdiL (CAAX protease family)
MPRLALIVELLVLFVGVPLACRVAVLRVPALPLLWLGTAYAAWQLRRDPHFNRELLWNVHALAPALPWIVAMFVPAALLMWLAVHRLAPQLEWSLVRERPLLWGAVMLGYPFLSVYPQGLVWRAFFFERYAPLFPARWMMVVASAAAFAFMHIVFRNRFAVALTFAGGLLFAWRYAVTGSLAASSFEHALYGCWLFTVGLGSYFYRGTIATVGAVVRS